MVASQESYFKTSNLITEINDTTAEQLCGGAINTPQTTEENSSNTTQTTGKEAIVPSSQAYNELGLIPFFPNLPTTKLPRLGPLDPATRNTTTPKNAINITIPLPLPLGTSK